MSEIPDDELDDLFRKSAEETEIPFDPEAWRRMEQKLDGNRPNGTIWCVPVAIEPKDRFGQKN